MKWNKKDTEWKEFKTFTIVDQQLVKVAKNLSEKLTEATANISSICSKCYSWQG